MLGQPAKVLAPEDVAQIAAPGLKRALSQTQQSYSLP